MENFSKKLFTDYGIKVPLDLPEYQAEYVHGRLGIIKASGGDTTEAGKHLIDDLYHRFPWSETTYQALISVDAGIKRTAGRKRIHNYPDGAVVWDSKKEVFVGWHGGNRVCQSQVKEKVDEKMKEKFGSRQ